MAKDIKNIVGPSLRKWRAAQGLSQEELAARLQVGGFDLSRTSLAKVEAQLRCVSDYELFKLSKILKIPLDSFFKK